MADRKLRILCLDGGGFRGLSSLFILQSMMERVENSAERDASNVAMEPRPCDYFDYITGTGIGGVIALLLGRLKFTISKSILVYRHLSLVLREAGFSPLFDIDKLLLEAERIVHHYEGKTDDSGRAETIVFAVEKGGRPRCIHSVDEKLCEVDPSTPIHELIAALMAAKGLFGEYTIVPEKESHGYTFLDRPYPFGYSNPAVEAIDAVIERERNKALHPDDSSNKIRDAILISIGTGQVAKEDIADLAILGSAHDMSLSKIVNPLTYWRMTQDATEVVNAVFSPDRTLGLITKHHDHVLNSACSRYAASRPGSCDPFRFNIQPVPDVGPSDFRSVKEVGERTDQYLHENRDRIHMVM
ncbi:hypothetical protein V8C42DRAFT_78783 [Trichoderma barbatum]